MTYSGWLGRRLQAAHNEVKEWPTWEQKCSSSTAKAENENSNSNNGSKKTEKEQQG